MLYVHPIVQVIAILLALYGLLLGIQRFKQLYLGKKVIFMWKTHIIIGEIALFIMLVGAVGGLATAYFYWQGVLITGHHAKIGLYLIIPLIFLGFITGGYMSRFSKERKGISLIHGLGNVILVILSLVQILTGWWVYNNFLK